MDDIELKVLNRMQSTNDYIVGNCGRYFWANSNVRGCLIEAASSDEVQAAQKIASNTKYIIKEIKKIII